MIIIGDADAVDLIKILERDRSNLINGDDYENELVIALVNDLDRLLSTLRSGLPEDNRHKDSMR